MDRAEITTNALALLDERGMNGLTTRALADRLGISAPSLYWHYPSKQHLLEDVATALVADVAALTSSADAPSSRLREVLVRFRAALLAHRDGGRVFAGTFPIGDAVLDMSEVGLAAYAASGVPAEEAADCWFNAIYLVLGSVIEQQAQSEQPELEKHRADFFDANRERPHVLRAAADVLDAQYDRRFERALEMIDGARRAAST